jgi:hypothetical protein
MERLFVKDFRMTFVLNRLFVTKFPFGNGSLQMEFVMERLFVKDFSFGEGSLQSCFFMEKAFCKGISLWRRTRGFADGRGSLYLCKRICLWNRHFVERFATQKGSA